MTRSYGVVLSCSEIDQLRADNAAVSLSLPCTIKRKSTVKDAWGTDKKLAFDTVATTLCGTKPPRAGILASYAYMIGSQATWQELNFKYGTDVRILDHILIGSDELIVQAILSQQSYNTLMTVLASEIQP
jgi:hypothetical protein